MLVEGRGNVPPSPEVVPISQGELCYFMDAANRINEFRGYARRADAWGNGFIDNPMLVGMLGEHAVCGWLNAHMGTSLRVDTSLRPRGDGGKDVTLHGYALQVKTRGERLRASLHKRLEGDGRIIPMPRCQAFVFARWAAAAHSVHILGWLRIARMTEVARRRRSTRAAHHNLVIDDAALEPMVRLPDEISLWRMVA